MSTVFRHSKRKTYYHRSYVPKALRQLLNERFEIWRSLDTLDKDEATVRGAVWDARVKRLFVTLKKDGHRMTQDQIDQLVSRWLDTELDDADDYRAVEGPFSDNDRDTKWLILHDQMEDASEALLSCNYRKVEHEAQELLKAAGLPALDTNGAEFGKLCRRLLQAKMDYASIEMDMWSHGESSEKRARRVATQVVNPVAGPAPTTVKASGPLFSVAVKSYLKENPKAVRTLPQVLAEFERFKECIGGDRPVASITKADGLKFKTYLIEARKVKWATIGKLLSQLSGLFRWCKRQGHIVENPITDLIPDKKIAQKEKAPRKPFSDSQLLSIFGSKEFRAQKDKRPERYWMIMLLLFSGARRDEIAQLGLDDISEEQGISYLRVTNEGQDQSVKNDGSKRRIPLHSSVLQLRFLSYVEEMRKAKAPRLFPQLTKGANGFGDAVGKYFARLLTKLGLTDKSLVLHSLRKSAITKLHEAGVPEKHVQILTGHTSSTVHESYIARDMVALSVLRDALEKLRYDEVVKALS